MSDVPKFCFPSNPDISGIGVRVAVYIQNLLSFAPAVFALHDTDVTPTELDNLETQSTNILITALALLVSTIVQALNKGLTNLHAVVILNLSWMNNTNLFIYFLLYVYSRLNDRERTQQDGSGGSGGGLSLWKKEINKALGKPVFYYGSAHLTVMAAIGIWFWHRPFSFGDPLACSRSASVAVLGHQVSLASEGLKGWSLFIYSLLLVPGLNLIVPAAFFTAPIFLYSRFTPKSSPRPALLRSFLCQVLRPKSSPRLPLGREPSRRVRGLISTTCGLVVLAIINILFLADTEVTLQKNSLQKGDANWTFGQTLALLLLLVPLRDILETLLERRAKMLGRKLFKASVEGDLGVVKDAHRQGADAKAKNPSLLAAVKNGHLNVVDFLLESGADVNARDGKTAAGDYIQSTEHLERSFRSTALMIAARKGRLDIVKKLIERQADVNAKDGYGRTALMFAARSGQLDIVKKLIGERADVDAKDDNGATALIYAAEDGQWDIVMKLIGGRADVDAKDDNSATALIYAAGDKQWEIVKKLIERRADVDAKDDSGATALIYAAGDGQWDIVKQLIESGADVDAKYDNGATALIYAAGDGQWDIVKQLIERRADVNAKSGYDSTALMYTPKEGRLDIVKQLIESQADVNAKNVNGVTALIYAAVYGQLDIVKQLIESGADVNAKDKHGETALQLADGAGYQDVVNVLKDYSTLVL